MTHLLTKIITTETYPDILKTTRITPTKKPDKPTDNIDSYRPICNLSVIDKILQQYIKDNLTNYLDINYIITKDNHGSRKGHSTTAALTSIQHYINTHYYTDKMTAIIQTDLSSAFDTVDHDILLDKLQHYGIEGSENNLIRSILNDRSQYVDIDGFISITTPANPCSVLQGSKLSSLLYVIYCNEIPLLHNLVGSHIMTQLTDTH